MSVGPAFCCGWAGLTEMGQKHQDHITATLGQDRIVFDVVYPVGDEMRQIIRSKMKLCTDQYKCFGTEFEVIQLCYICAGISLRLSACLWTVSEQGYHCVSVPKAFVNLQKKSRRHRLCGEDLPLCSLFKHCSRINCPL